MPPPRAFVSYSHDSPTHKLWVRKLASDLRLNGVDAMLDLWDLSPGDDIAAFMEKGLREANRVVVVCSAQYVEKANEGKGGVGYEKMIVTAELIENLGTKKFIPIIRGAGEPPVPTFLGYRMFIDFEDDEKYATSLEVLLREIFGMPDPGKPPIGENPFEGSGNGKVSIASGEVGLVPESSVVPDSLGELVEGDVGVDVEVLKSLIAEPVHVMKLHDFIMPLAAQARTDLRNSSLVDFGTKPTQEEFLKRIETGNRATNRMSRAFAVGCYWANEEQASEFSKALTRIAIPRESTGAFYDAWETVASYPVLRVLYAGALAAYSNGSLKVLRKLMIGTKMRTRSYEQEAPVVTALYSRAGFAQGYWKWLPGRENHHIPVSSYLEESLRPFFDDLVHSDDEFSALFDRFELFQSLVYADTAEDGDSNRFWAPLGSYVWRRDVIFDETRQAIEQEGDRWQPLQAGFFAGSAARVLERLEALREFCGRVRIQLGIY